jgi:hypothetical protein
MHHQHLCATVAQNVANLRRLEVPIDRHAISPQPIGGVDSFEERKIVAHQQRHGIARPDAKLCKA